MSILFAITQRPRFRQFVRAVFNASNLVDQNASLQEKLRQAHADLVDARNALTSAQRTAQFYAAQIDELRSRIDELEARSAENGEFIRSAIIYIDALEGVMAEHKIAIPKMVKKPVVPRHLREGR